MSSTPILMLSVMIQLLMSSVESVRGVRPSASEASIHPAKNSLQTPTSPHQQHGSQLGLRRSHQYTLLDSVVDLVFWHRAFNELPLQWINPSDITISSKLLGYGSTSHVYQGTYHISSRRQVNCAIKMIYDDIPVKNQEYYLKREMAALHIARNAPNVVQAFGYTTLNNRSSIILELSSLGTLRHVLQHDDIPLITRLNLVADAVLGSKKLSELDILHGDLTPGNIVIFSTHGEGRAKLCDLGGVVSLHTPATHMTTTVAYASPEQLLAYQEGEQWGIPSDVWSLGIIIYEAITLQQWYRFPHQQYPDNIFAYFYNKVIVNREIPDMSRLDSIPDIDSRFKKILKQCFEYDGVDRPTMSQLHTALTSTIKRIRVKASQSKETEKRVNRARSMRETRARRASASDRHD